MMLSFISWCNDEVDSDINTYTIKLSIALDEIYDHSNVFGFAVSEVKDDKLAYQDELAIFSMTKKSSMC